MPGHRFDLYLRAWFDARVRALAAGMSFSEIRAALDGDAPTERPNPRYLAHTLSMLLHMRPRNYPLASTWFTHTFRLGFFTTLFFVIEVVTGLLLMVYYVPTPEGAYDSILKLMSEVPFGALLRDIHRLAAEAMIVCAFLHMVRVFVTGSYKAKRAFTWLTGVGLLVITLGLGFSGYLLIWDQLAYWAVTIGTSMAQAVPIIGKEVNLLLRGAPEIGAAGLLRFYLLHVIALPLLAILILGVHYYRVARLHGISLPAWIEETPLLPQVKAALTRRVDFIPGLMVHEAMLVSLTLLTMVAASLFFYDAPLEHHADPQHTPMDTQAPWFFLWVQGLLKLGDRTWMGVIVPTALLVFLAVIPYVARNPRRHWRARPFGLGLCVAILIGLLVLSYMGTHYYGIGAPTAPRIIQDLAPEEGRGPLHAVPYTELLPGIYVVSRTDTSGLPASMARLIHTFAGRLNDASLQGVLPEGRGILIVEEQQADLKRVTLRITWREAELDAPTSYERAIYLHRDR